jgi:hypothetical protein
LLYTVANAPIRMFPTPHILVHDVFPVDFYRELRRMLPPNSAYKTLNAMGRVAGDYPETRLVVPLTPQDVAALDEPYRSFWNSTASWLLGGSFGQIMLQKFAPFLAQRFENPATVEYEHEVLVVQDRTDYALGPHTDSVSKVLSLLFYLPADDSMPHLGTSIYFPKDPSFTCAGGPHYPFEQFNRLLTMPYVPNTLFGFLKTPDSFHGVERVAEPNIERALLLYDIRVARARAAAPVAEIKASTQFTF